MEFEPQENAAFQPSPAWHDCFEEETLVIRQSLLHPQTRLGRIVVVESMGNLHDSDGGISKKANCPHEEVALRDKIGIKNRDQVRVRFGQGMIYVAGFGVRVVASRQIANPLCVAELLEPRRLPSSSSQTLRFG